jgi:hypothetical protein
VDRENSPTGMESSREGERPSPFSSDKPSQPSAYLFNGHAFTPNLLTSDQRARAVPLYAITPSHEATVGETAEERRLRHRLEKIDAALDELGAPKTEAAHGLTMELSRVGRIKRLAQSATRERKDMDQETIFAALVELGRRIEACGASVELTNAVILCSDLRMAVGNQWNPPDEYAEQRVRKALAVTEKKLCPPSP